MDENAIHDWLIQCFGPVQGEMAWNQIQNLPPEIREQMLNQDPSSLPDPAQMQAMMTAMSTGGLGSFTEMQNVVNEGPINVKLAKTLALQQANDAGSERIVSAADGAIERRAMSEANLWLDTACEFNPVSGETQALTRANWVEGTIDKWADIAAPVAKSMNDALTSVIADRLGDIDGEITGMFAGPVPIQIPEGMKDPKQLMKLFANTSYAMQLGQAAGALSHEVRGSYDQGLALLDNPAGGLIMQNVETYAKSLDIDVTEVTEFLALHEAAYARLYAAVPWLMPRFEALIGKYARGIAIDLDAMEEQLRDAGALDPEALSGAVNLTNVGIADTPEQKEAMRSIETLLALVEGWVDCVVWRAGMAHIPHIEQLREMTRRERAVGGPAERTFESLMGLQLRPKKIREAAQLWETITREQGAEARDAMWSHPDMLPTIPQDAVENANVEQGETAAVAAADESSSTIDWDDEFSKLLSGEESVDGGETEGSDTTNDASDSNDSDDSTDADGSEQGSEQPTD